MSFSVIVELALLVAYAVVILGGKQKRDQGWKIVCSLLAVAAAAQCASMAVVVSAAACSSAWTLCTSGRQAGNRTDESFYRPASSTATIDSSLAGPSTGHGSCVPSAGVFWRCPRPVSLRPLFICRKKAIMSLYQVTNRGVLQAADQDTPDFNF